MQEAKDAVLWRVQAAPPPAKVDDPRPCPPAAADGSAHCPHFLPRSKAVLLATCHKAGLGLGFEHGTGVLMARLPGEAAAAGGLRPSEFAAFKSLAWSPPCFISLAGLSSGFTAGLQRADTMIGVLTDAALDRWVLGCLRACLPACTMDSLTPPDAVRPHLMQPWPDVWREAFKVGAHTTLHLIDCRIMHGGMLSLTAEWTVCLLDHNNRWVCCSRAAPTALHLHCVCNARLQLAMHSRQHVLCWQHLCACCNLQRCCYAPPTRTPAPHSLLPPI